MPFEGLFGYVVAIDGNVALVSVPFADDRSGYVYTYELSNGVWYNRQRLYAADQTDRDLFGSAIAIDADTAVIAAPRDDGYESERSRVYVFGRGSDGFVQQAKLVIEGPAQHSIRSVSIDRDTIIVGAPGSESTMIPGSATVFARTQEGWKIEHTFTGSEVGFGVDVQVRGDTAWVAARDGKLRRAYAFERQRGAWSRTQVIELPESTFGLSLGADDKTLALGAPVMGTGGVVHVYANADPLGVAAPDGGVAPTPRQDSGGCNVTTTPHDGWSGSMSIAIAGLLRWCATRRRRRLSTRTE